jgi:hypothetical protein
MQVINKLFFFIIPINLFFDVTTSIIWERGGLISIVRGTVLSFITLSIIINYFNWGRIKHLKLIFFFSFYVLTLVIVSSNPSVSLRVSLKILLSILTLPAAVLFFRTKQDLLKLNKTMILGMLILLANYIISQIFNLGVASYTGGTELLMGNLNDDWSVFTYVVLVAPLIYKMEATKRTRLLVVILTIAIGVLLVLSLKRSAIIAVSFGLSYYFLRTDRKRRAISFSLLVFMILLILFPLIENTFQTRFEARLNRFEKPQSEVLQEEGRFIETIVVWEETFSFVSPLKSIFGMEAFNSVGNYGGGRFGRRGLHVDYNLILNTLGIFGLVLYLSIFWAVFVKHKHLYKSLKGWYPHEFRIVFEMLLLTQFVTSFGGEMYSITFRTIIYVYMGALLGYLYSQSKNDQIDFPSFQQNVGQGQPER